MRFALQTGLTLKSCQRTLELVRELGDGCYVLEDVLTRRPVEYTRQRLVDDIHSRRLIVIVGEKPSSAASGAADTVTEVLDVSSLNERERSLLEHRLLYVKALARHRVRRGQRKEVERIIDIVSRSAGVAKRPAATTVMLWARKYQKSGMNPLALVDRHRVRRSPKRIHETVEKLIWRVLKRSYFTTACRSLRFAHDDLKRELKLAKENRLIGPEDAEVAYATLQRRVDGVDLYQRVASREVDFTRFNRHLSRSKLNWRVRNEESAIPG